MSHNAVGNTPEHPGGQEKQVYLLFSKLCFYVQILILHQIKTRNFKKCIKNESVLFLNFVKKI